MRHGPFGRNLLALDREQVTAGRIQAQADDLAPDRPDVGEDAGQPGSAVDVDCPEGNARMKQWSQNCINSS